MSGSTFKKNRGKYSNKTSLEKKISKLKKPGKTYTKAQLMALKRKAEGKSIADVKKSNKEAMQDRARKRYADFKAKKNLKINKKNNTNNKNLSVTQKIENQKEKNKKIIKKKNFLSNLK